MATSTVHTEPPELGLQDALDLSLLITRVGDIIRARPENERGALFSRVVGALLRASDAPCLVTVVTCEEAERDALATAKPEGNA